MTDSRPTPEELMAQIRKQVAKLPPGSDVAGFITRKAAEMNALLAQEIAAQRQTACDEAGFSPSAVPPLRPSGEQAGEKPAPPHDPSA